MVLTNFILVSPLPATLLGHKEWCPPQMVIQKRPVLCPVSTLRLQDRGLASEVGKYSYNQSEAVSVTCEGGKETLSSLDTGLKDSISHFSSLFSFDPL